MKRLRRYIDVILSASHHQHITPPYCGVLMLQHTHFKSTNSPQLHLRRGNLNKDYGFMPLTNLKKTGGISSSSMCWLTDLISSCGLNLWRLGGHFLEQSNLVTQCASVWAHLFMLLSTLSNICWVLPQRQRWLSGMNTALLSLIGLFQKAKNQSF